ncbi:MAG: hypothetical protein EHM36_04330 [Deltaproteobacteria bacterium]|nr:MAG: hypothetical protein EHM36_04330 [Deltaproteobacteria bacterium]
MSEKENSDHGEKRLDSDFDAFERRIDEEIDRLFIPAGESPDAGEQPGDLKILGEPARREAQTKPSIVLPGAQTARKEPSPSPLMDSFSGGSVADETLAVGRSDPSVAVEQQNVKPQKSPSLDREEMGTLIESFNVAYLSLDWEYSNENISRLERALGKLHPYCLERHETDSLFKVFKALLEHLKAQPDALSSQVVETIRDIQDLLKTLLLSRDIAGPQEKKQFRDLIERIRSIQKEARSLERSKIPLETVKDVPPWDGAAQTSLGFAPSDSDSAPDGEPLEDLRDWMKSSRLRFSVASKRLEDESRRLLQMEEILNRKEALAPIVSRLGKIRTGLDEHMAFVRGQEGEWDRRIGWLEDYMKDLDGRMSGLHKNTEPDSASAPGTLGPDAIPAHDTIEQDPVVAQEQVVCFYRLSGKRFAIPVSNVVKIQQVSTDKANKIRGRGYATLTDFRPFFRKMKTGLIGAWSDLPARVLKDFQFIPLPYDALRAPGVPSMVGTVILVSNGEDHGIIFTEPSGVEVHSERVMMVSDSENTLGVIQSESDPPVEVLNMDRILKSFIGESS